MALASTGAPVQLQPRRPRVVRRCLRRPHGRSGPGVARDRRRRERARLRAHRIGQDARRVPVGARPAGTHRRRRRGPCRGYPGRLREPAEGARLRHRAQPAGAVAGDRSGRRARGDPDRRHPPARAGRDAAQPARHPRHDARVPVPDPDLAGAGDVGSGGGRDRRRDPRGRPLQARLPPGADAGAPRAARGRGGRPRPPRAPAHRTQRDPEPARGDRPLPRGSADAR